MEFRNRFIFELTAALEAVWEQKSGHSTDPCFESLLDHEPYSSLSDFLDSEWAKWCEQLESEAR